MMKKAFYFFISFCVMTFTDFPVSSAQQLEGAWRLMSRDGKPVTETCIKIYASGYYMFASYHNGQFREAGGGRYAVTAGSYTEIPDFLTADSTRVRQPHHYSIKVGKDELLLEIRLRGEVLRETWKKVDGGKTPLTGAWRFAARVGDDGLPGERRPADAPRQTIKVLFGSYFQWAAFNYETRQFLGSGGGEYVCHEGHYAETIHFFSRDNSRAGITLNFTCRLDGSDWYHSGKGTTGNPVNEVWERWHVSEK
jgi:hypothetical protein